MNAKVSALFFALGLAGCSAQPPQPAPAATPGWQITKLPPGFAPPPAKDSQLPKAQVCQLGTTCLTMDSRPFETCLVDTKHCDQKLAELMLVEKPKVHIEPPAPLKR